MAELNDIGFSEHAEKLFGYGEKSVDSIIIEGKLIWEVHWMNVGRALDEAREQIMRFLGQRNPKAQKYRELMGEFLRARGFDRIDAGARSWLQKCMDHETEIADWRVLLSESQRLELNHPKRVWAAWQRTLRADDPAEKRPTLKDEVVRLQAELDEARAALSIYMAAERPVVAPDPEKVEMIDDLGRKELERRANEWRVKYEEAIALRSMLAAKLMEVERERDDLLKIVEAEADKDPMKKVYLFQALKQDGTVVYEDFDDLKWPGFHLFQTRKAATEYAMELMRQTDVENFQILERRQYEFDLTGCYLDNGEWYCDHYGYPRPKEPSTFPLDAEYASA